MGYRVTDTSQKPIVAGGPDAAAAAERDEIVRQHAAKRAEEERNFHAFADFVRRAASQPASVSDSSSSTGTHDPAQEGAGRFRDPETTTNEHAEGEIVSESDGESNEGETKEASDDRLPKLGDGHSVATVAPHRVTQDTRVFLTSVSSEATDAFHTAPTPQAHVADDSDSARAARDELWNRIVQASDSKEEVSPSHTPMQRQMVEVTIGSGVDGHIADTDVAALD